MISDFEGRKLQDALFETLQNRGTPYNRDTLDKVAELANCSEPLKKLPFLNRVTRMTAFSFLFLYILFLLYI